MGHVYPFAFVVSRVSYLCCTNITNSAVDYYRIILPIVNRNGSSEIIFFNDHLEFNP
jgi:hypothetical protein